MFLSLDHSVLRPYSLCPSSLPNRLRPSLRLLEQMPGQPRLPDDRLDGAGAQFPMVGHRHGESASFHKPLHDDVASPPSYLREALLGQDSTNLPARQHPQLTQLLPRGG